MNEVQLHSFLACCTVDVLESIFPTWEKQFITFDEVKSVSVFEETEGHENTISFWFQYLSDLAKYESGIVMVTNYYRFIRPVSYNFACLYV
jgi:chitinase